MIRTLMIGAMLWTAGGDAPPARDGNVAIREEYDRAAETGSVEAWRLFIARHPDHPLTAEARRRLDALTAARPGIPDADPGD